ASDDDELLFFPRASTPPPSPAPAPEPEPEPEPAPPARAERPPAPRTPPSRPRPPRSHTSIEEDLEADLAAVEAGEAPPSPFDAESTSYQEPPALRESLEAA